MVNPNEAILQISKEDFIIQTSQKQLQAFPDKKKKIRTKLVVVERSLNAKKKKQNELSTRIKERETLVSVEQEKVDKSNERMVAVTNQKEYMALQREIEGAQKTIKRMEDQILDLELENEVLEKELSEIQKEYDIEKAIVDKEEESITTLEEQLMEKIGSSTKSKEELLPFIEDDIRAQYNKLMFRKLVPAAVEISTNSCNGCAMTIRAQVFNEIIKDTKGVCPSCQRILLYKAPEIPEEKIPSKKTKKKTK